MAGKTGLRDFLGRFVLEGDDLQRIAFFQVGLAWSMARLAAGHLPFPAADSPQLRMRGMRIRFEFIFMTVLAGIAPDVVGIVRCRNRLLWCRMKRSVSG